MKKLTLIFVVFISSIAFSQEECPIEDCSTPATFGFSCETFQCGDLTFPDDTRFKVTSPNNQDPDLFFYARVQTIASGKRFWIGVNLASSVSYYSEPSLTASNTNGTDYFSPSGFRIDVGGQGLITCIQPN